MKKYDELGRLVIDSSEEIPKNMSEDEEHEFWKKHAMSEKLLEESYIEEEEEEELSKRFESRLDLSEEEWLELPPDKSIIEHYKERKDNK